DLRLLLIGESSQPVPLPLASPLERDFSRRFRVAHPLGAASRGHQEPLSAEFEQIDWRGIDLPALAPADLQQIIMGKAQSQPHQRSEDPVENALDCAGRTK